MQRMVETMESESEHTIHSDVHPVVDSDNGDDMGSEEPQNPTIPLVLSLVACFLFGIAIIVAGYFKGNMHLVTVLKNAANS
jgi:hypothetical protein